MTKDASLAPFNIPTENTGFSSRSKDVFAGLDSLEKKHDEKQKDLEDNPGAKREQRKLWKDEPEVDAVVAGSSPFKRPSSSYRGGPNRGAYKRHRKAFHNTPDYVQNPEKWKRYSLEDSDTSESLNSQAAFKFLEDRRKLREAEENMNTDDQDVSDGKMVFKKPRKNVGHTLNKVVKQTKLDEISIGHLDSDSSSFDEPLAANSSVNEINSEGIEPPKSVKLSFKKGNRKKNFRVRKDDD